MLSIGIKCFSVSRTDSLKNLKLVFEMMYLSAPTLALHLMMCYNQSGTIFILKFLVIILFIIWGFFFISIWWCRLDYSYRCYFFPYLSDISFSRWHFCLFLSVCVFISNQLVSFLIELSMIFLTVSVSV